MTDSLRVWWKLPELSDRLTMLVIVGTRSAEHSLRSQVGIGSESHCLLGQLCKILEISDFIRCNNDIFFCASRRNIAKN